MNISKRFPIAAALVLIVGLAANATAQSQSNLSVNTMSPLQPIETTVEMKLNAIEVSDGAVGMTPKMGETLFGYSFLGRTVDGLPGSFMFSMNCIPAVFTPGDSNYISGGSWALPVYMQPFRGLNNVYMGSLYGKVTEGKMGWDKLGNAEVYFNFSVEGGTQTWEWARGYGTFAGTLVENEKGTTTLSGLLTITYATVPIN